VGTKGRRRDGADSANARRPDASSLLYHIAASTSLTIHVALCLFTRTAEKRHRRRVSTASSPSTFSSFLPSSLVSLPFPQRRNLCLESGSFDRFARARECSYDRTRDPRVSTVAFACDITSATLVRRSLLPRHDDRLWFRDRKHPASER